MKKAFQVIRDALSGLLMLLSVVIMVFTLITVLGRGGDRSVLGVRMLVVMSDSMRATDFSAGDMIFIKQVDPQTLQAGDIISYHSTDPDSYGKLITHKIRTVTTDVNGEPCFTTYGTTTNVDDELPVRSRDIQGKYLGRIPKLGLLVQALKNNPIYMVALAAGLVAFYILSGVLGTLFEKKKQQELTPTQIETQASNPMPGTQQEAPGENPQGGVQTEDEEE